MTASCKEALSVYDFLLKLKSFFEGIATSEDEPGLLKHACGLYLELDKMTSPLKPPGSNAQQPEPAVVSATGRLRASVASAGKTWIGSLMQTMSVEEVVSKVNETLPAQTAEIKAAVASLNLAKELGAGLPKVEEASFDELVEAMPIYIKAKSVDGHLLDPATVQKSREFCVKVDGQLEEQVESFLQSVAELDKLALKYR